MTRDEHRDFYLDVITAKVNALSKVRDSMTDDESLEWQMYTSQILILQAECLELAREWRKKDA